MRVRIKSKKRFGLWCFVFLLMILNLIFAVSKRLEEGSALYGNEKSVSSFKALAASNDGSIAFSESKYFKRYVIDCKSEMAQIRSQEDKEYISVFLKKDDIEKVNVKKEDASGVKDVFYDNSADNLIIKVKKEYNENNLVYVDSTNNKRIVVLIAKEENPFKHTVVLDAGHGGNDIGANLGSIYEKDITLKILNYTAEELMFNGYKVVKTRDEDKFLELKEISNIANSASGDVFVSIHINDNKLTKYKGVTTYYYDPLGYQKDERIKLARTMQKELVKSDNWEDRGIARDNLAVLRDTKIPCVLLECGFLSNSEDRDKLLKDEVLQDFGKNISVGIDKYLSAE